MAYNPYGYGRGLSYPEGVDGGLYYSDNQQSAHGFNYNGYINGGFSNSYNGYMNGYNGYGGYSNGYGNYTTRKIENIEEEKNVQKEQKEQKLQQEQKEQNDNVQEYAGMPYWHRVKRNTPFNSGRRLSRHVKPDFTQLDVPNGLGGDEDDSGYQSSNNKRIPFESPFGTSSKPNDSSDFMEAVRDRERESINGEKGRLEYRMMSEQTRHELDKQEQVERHQRG